MVQLFLSTKDGGKSNTFLSPLTDTVLMITICIYICICISSNNAYTEDGVKYGPSCSKLASPREIVALLGDSKLDQSLPHSQLIGI